MFIPKMTPVESSSIKSIGYFDNDLYVEFKYGSIYKYLNIPESVYTSFMNSESKGQFFVKNIRNNDKYNYDYIR